MAFAAGARTAGKRAKPTKFQRNIRSAANAQQRVERNRTNERARLSNFETGERQIRTQQRLAAETSEYRSRRIEAGRTKSAQAGRERVYDAVGTAAKPAGSAMNSAIVVLMVVFGLIIFYSLVTHPQPTSTFFGRLGNLLGAISTNAPLFEKTATTKTS